MNTTSQPLSSSRRQEGGAAVRRAGFMQVEASMVHRQLTLEEKRKKNPNKTSIKKKKSPETREACSAPRCRAGLAFPSLRSSFISSLLQFEENVLENKIGANPEVLRAKPTWPWFPSIRDTSMTRARLSSGFKCPCQGGKTPLSQGHEKSLKSSADHHEPPLEIAIS